MDTTENNKLIAEFMGLKIHSDFDTMCENLLRKDSSFNTALFNASWDWLMTVVDKIESIKIEDYKVLVEISTNICTIAPAHWEELINIQSSDRFSAVYHAVIDFINWYNEQTNNNG